MTKKLLTYFFGPFATYYILESVDCVSLKNEEKFL